MSRILFPFFLAVMLMSACKQEGLRSENKPNVVIILTDDQGWGDLSINGNRNLQTPRIDELSVNGASFDRFYVSPVCSPTRAELLTGRFHSRGGVYSTSAGGERLDLDETTIAELFKAAGYRTAAYGKWHNGMRPPYHPNARGFDDYYGFCSGHWGHYFSPMLEHNGRIVQGEGYLSDDFTNHAISFIEESKGKPFFLYIPYNTPHSPMQAPEEYGYEYYMVEQKESPYKDFIPVSMGDIKLAVGEGTLTLKALEIPGDAAIDFRLLMITHTHGNN